MAVLYITSSQSPPLLVQWMFMSMVSHQVISITYAWSELKCLDNRSVQIIKVWIIKVGLQLPFMKVKSVKEAWHVMKLMNHSYTDHSTKYTNCKILKLLTLRAASKRCVLICTSNLLLHSHSVWYCKNLLVKVKFCHHACYIILWNGTTACT